VEPRFIPYRPERLPPAEMARRAKAFRDVMDGRRSVRMFSSEPVPRALMEDLLGAAGTAPSGAHKQPWSFVAVSAPEVKRRIREAAEVEERRFYAEVAPEAWLRDLAPLGTDWVKAHLTDAPWVVVVFARDHGLAPEGQKLKHYYVNESVGIAVGFFLAAIRHAGLSALTHTPSPMGFLRELLGRPANERAYVVIPVGYPAPDAMVPDLRRKSLGEFVAWVEGPLYG
jgi:iodotyrosine deiodinase